MKEKINVIDLFCGCGGISEGFRLAGFNIIGGLDFNEESVKTYQKNFPKAKAICADLLNFNDQRIIEEFGNSKIDVIVGGPPCQGFSSANRWQKENADPRNKLFYEYLRFVEILKPKVVLIENVRGILSRDNGYAKDRIQNLLEKLGYNVNCDVLKASDFGVPQNRFRAFFVAIRNEYSNDKFDFNKLTKREKVNVNDAIGELYNFKDEQKEAYIINQDPSTEYRKYLRSKTNKIHNHEVKFPADITQKRISHVPQGGNWMNIPKNLFSNDRSNRHSSAFKRLAENDCSVTIDTGNAHSNYFHPKYNRIPTVREAARIQSFNDDFVFVGSRTSQYKQVGNAVPPLLANAVAIEIKKILKKS
jgi:DNA (cytosine-5)-methyltransferase 1